MELQQVILVDEQDAPVGVMEKMEAHQKGVLHRAFSIFIFNDRGEMLLQQRADDKYHSAGLWTNACCSHPSPGEDTIDAAHRRLQEEMGFDTELKKSFGFIYKASFENGLTEYEFDHVFIGNYNDPVQFNPSEVKAVTYKSVEEIERLIEKEPQQFTAWFIIAFPRLKQWRKEEF
ncbi:MAG TPA: isopentenyl-diphosphate Delta-isomerase [Chitinophagaceae bacterium]|jgi:isopentenyl-diphosphate delta-isomerase|nr:isopentenyl-diphosphate Delta-isomerase [Chitinophagaceae bacterium]